MDFIIEHHDHIDGDICEAGVFRGRSLLATGLLLKELGSPKQVFGYDTFEGFPPVYHDKDDLSRFDGLAESGGISAQHYLKVIGNIELRSLDLPEISVANISGSGDFSNTAIQDVGRKVKFLGLDNVHLVQGCFADTMIGNRPFMAALLDCDLYMSYKTALPFVWKNLVLGGYIYLDEYYSLKFPGARIATNEFFATKIDRPYKHKVRLGDFERWGVRKTYDL